MRFKDAKEQGEVVEKNGYHQPRKLRTGCGCRLTTDKGAYRDVTIALDDRIIHYYHQSPVVTELPDGSFKIDSCGYRTSTTKERINRYLPSGYYLYQEDYEWFLKTPDGEREFTDGMRIDP